MNCIKPNLMTVSELNHAIRSTYNFAPTFCLFVPNFVADYLKKSYSKDTFNLKEIDLHNAIEHDGSITRRHDLLLYSVFT